MAKQKLTEKEKAERARERLIEKAKEYQISTYVRKIVAPLFQKMIRAEWAARKDSLEQAVVDGRMGLVRRRRGFCACVTCGRVLPWIGGGGAFGQMHAGHFLASRRNSIVFEEDNIAPQCAHCNRHLGGAPQEFRLWMIAVHGKATVERLERLKTESRQFTREELVDMRIAFQNRLRIAEELMKGG